MSRIVNTRAVSAEPLDEPALKIRADDVSGVSDSVDELTDAFNLLSEKIGQMLSRKTDEKTLYEILDAITIGHKSLLDRLNKLQKPQKRGHWVFKVKHDSYGDLSSVEAIEIND